MLQLRTGPAAPAIVKLAGDATVRVRGATIFEMDLAVARAGKLLAGLIQSRESAAVAADYLGAEFVGADFTASEWVDAAAKRIILIDLAVTCIEGWDGIVDDAGEVIDKPTRPTIALLLRSVSAARAIEEAMRADINIEVAEKNGSGALPIGEVPAAESIAPNASAPGQSAPLA